MLPETSVPSSYIRKPSRYRPVSGSCSTSWRAARLTRSRWTVLLLRPMRPASSRTLNSRASGLNSHSTRPALSTEVMVWVAGGVLGGTDPT